MLGGLSGPPPQPTHQMEPNEKSIETERPSTTSGPPEALAPPASRPVNGGENGVEAVAVPAATKKTIDVAEAKADAPAGKEAKADALAGKEAEAEAPLGKKAASGAAKQKNNVRKIRIERMMSKAELARRANLSVLTIDRIEKGFGCRMDTKRKILEALGLSLDDRVRVFGEEE